MVIKMNASTGYLKPHNTPRLSIIFNYKINFFSMEFRSISTIFDAFSFIHLDLSYPILHFNWYHNVWNVEWKWNESKAIPDPEPKLQFHKHRTVAKCKYMYKILVPCIQWCETTKTIEHLNVGYSFCCLFLLLFLCVSFFLIHFVTMQQIVANDCNVSMILKLQWVIQFQY